MPENGGRLVLITGANGQVGRHALLEYADGTKADCIVATDLTDDYFVPASAPRLDYKFVRADLRRRDDLRKIKEIVEKRPERKILVLDIGALFRYDAPWKDLYDCNVTGQINLAEEVALPLQDQGREVRTVFWGAAAVYGKFNNSNYPLPAREDYPLDPQSDYAKTKVAAEEWLLHYHKSFGLWVTIMRCGAIYGEWGRYGMANGFILQLLGMLEPLIMGNKANQYGKNRVALVHARDTVRIADFLASQEEANGRVFNVRDNSVYRLETIAQVQAEACDLKVFDRFRMKTDDFEKYIDKKIAKMSREAGVEPVADIELMKMIPLDSFIAIDSLKALFEKARVNFESYLLYPDSIEGLRAVIRWFKTRGRKEGYLNV